MILMVFYTESELKTFFPFDNVVLFFPLFLSHYDIYQISVRFSVLMSSSQPLNLNKKLGLSDSLIFFFLPFSVSCIVSNKITYT